MASTCRIVARRNPFDDDIIEAEAPVGFRLAEILSPDGHYHAESNGERIEWQTYAIREADELVTVIGLPGEPGTISSALFAIGYALGTSAIGYAIGTAVLFAATYGAYIAAAASLVTVATMDAPSVQQNGVPERLNSLTGASNRFAPYAPVPVLYGERRFFPPLCAQPYTELIGNNQYINLLLLVSLGDVEVSAAKIGDAAVNTYEGIEITSSFPTAPDWLIVTDTSVAVQLDDEDWVTPNTNHTAASGADATALAIDFDFPIGLIYTNSKGDRRPVKIHFTVEFRVSGSSDPWVNIRTLDWRAMTNGNNITLADPTGVPNRPGSGGIVASTRTTLTSVGNITANSGSGSTRTITVGTGYTTVSGAYYDIKVTLSSTQVLWCPATPTSIGAGVTTWTVSENYARHMTVGMAASITRTDSGQLMIAQQFGEAFRTGLKWPTPAADTYEIKVTRTFLNQNDDFTNNAPLLTPSAIGYEMAKYQQIMVWSTIHTYTSRQAVTLPSTIEATFLKVRVRSTDQLNGTLDNLSVLGKRKLRTWSSGGGFAAASLTRSPAWAFLDMVMNTGVNQRGITTALAADNIDLAALKAWHDGTITAEEFTYDEVIDYPVSVYNCLRRAAGVAWAGVSVLDGKFTVIEDKYNTPVQMFSPRNSWGFQATKSFASLPHALKVQFDSEDADNKTDQIVVYDDGYNSDGTNGTGTGYLLYGGHVAGSTTLYVDTGTGTILAGDHITFPSDTARYIVATPLSGGSLTIAAPGLISGKANNLAVTVEDKTAATKFESLRLPGIVNPGHAWKMGRRMIALAKLRPETFSFQADVENILCQRGDSVSLLHDVTLWGLGSARITAKAVDTPTAGTTTVTLDESILTASATYAMRVRRTTATPPVFDEVTAVPVIPSNYNTQWKVTNAQAANWTAGDFVAVGESGSVTQKAKVLSIRPGADLKATITCADDTSASATSGVYGAHRGTIPAYTPNITKPLDPRNIVPAQPTITDARSDPNMAVISPDGSRLMIVSVMYSFGLDSDRFATQKAYLRYGVSTGEGEEPNWLQVEKVQADGFISTPGLESGITYLFQVRLWRGGRFSQWSNEYEYTVPAPGAEPEPFETLTVTGRPGGFECIIGFPNRENIGVDYFEILYATANDRADVSAKTHQFRPVSDLGAVNAVTTFIPVLSPVTQHWFWVRWVDTFGTPSAWLPTSATGGTSATNIRVVNNPQGPQVNDDPWFQEAIIGAVGDLSRPWTHLSGSGAVIATITDGVAGNTCLRSNTAVQKVIASTLKMPVDLSKTYAARARIRSTGGSNYGGYLLVAFYDSAGALIAPASEPGWPHLGTYHYFHYDDPWPGTFTQISLTFGALGICTIPTNAKTMRVGALMHQSGSGSVSGAQEIQDLRIDEVIGSVLIEDRAIEASKLKADLILTSMIRTLGSGNRVELEGGHDFPFWIGSGTKGSSSPSAGSGARVYYDADLDKFVVTGTLKTSTIEADAGSALDVITSGGAKASVFGSLSAQGTAGTINNSDGEVVICTLPDIVPPTNTTASIAYKRLATMQQPILMTFTGGCSNYAGPHNAEVRLQHRYDSTGSWTTVATHIFATTQEQSTKVRTLYLRPKSSWTTLSIRVTCVNTDATNEDSFTASINALLPNLGLQDVSYTSMS